MSDRTMLSPLYAALREIEEWTENVPIEEPLKRAFDAVRPLDEALDRITAKLAFSRDVDPALVADAVDIMLKRLQDLEQRAADGSLGGTPRTDSEGRVILAHESVTEIVNAIEKRIP